MATCGRVPRVCAEANAAGKSAVKPTVEWQQPTTSTTPVRREHHAGAKQPIRHAKRPAADATATTISWHARATIWRLRTAAGGPTTRFLSYKKYGRTAIFLTVGGGFYVQ